MRRNASFSGERELGHYVTDLITFTLLGLSGGGSIASGRGRIVLRLAVAILFPRHIFLLLGARLLVLNVWGHLLHVSAKLLHLNLLLHS